MELYLFIETGKGEKEEKNNQSKGQQISLTAKVSVDLERFA